MAVKKRTKDLTFWQKLYIPEIAKGLALTFKKMIGPKFTVQYPEEKFIPPASYRGRPVFVLDKNGEERCVACGLCARVCPPLAIEVQADETEREKERYPVKFEINMLRCIFCGMCEEACPKSAIYLTDRLVDVETNRGSFIYGKDKLVEKINERIDITPRQSDKQKNAVK